MPGIDTSSRKPFIVSAFSNRLVWLVIAIAVLGAYAVVRGFTVRAQRSEAQKQVHMKQAISTDPATSNRQQVQGIRVNPVSMSGLPVSTQSPYIPQSYPPNSIQPNASGTYSPGSIPQFYAPGQAPTSPFMSTAYPAHQPIQGFPPTPAYEPPPAQVAQSLPSPEQSRLQQAIEAPTSGASRGESLINSSPPSFYPVGTPHATMSPIPIDLNNQSGKLKFNDPTQPGDSLPAARVPPASRWVVQRGTVIPAMLPNRIVSDLPGDLIAEVVRDVYDSISHKYVELPAGSHLVGQYNSSVSYGQSRVQIAWNAVYFPDGSYINLDRMPGHAADGASGLKDQVDNHLARIIGGVALSSILSAGLQLSQNHSNASTLQYPSAGEVASSAVGTQAVQAGQQLTQHNLAVQPTLKIRPGEIFSVLVNKDIIFTGPYTPMEVK